MALLGLLQANETRSGTTRFVVKGGVAIELRLRGRARATRDLDLTVHSPVGNLVEIIESAIEGEFNGFTFRRNGAAHVMPNATIRIRIAAQYKSQSWTSVQVDASPSELPTENVEYTDSISMAEFGLATPPPVPCLSLPVQLAQKVHALTQPRSSIEDPVRTRDLVDILLLREFVTDFRILKKACVAVFSVRLTHSWPPEFEDLEISEAEFARIAAAAGSNDIDLAEALHQIGDFVSQIDASIT